MMHPSLTMVICLANFRPTTDLTINGLFWCGVKPPLKMIDWFKLHCLKPTVRPENRPKRKWKRSSSNHQFSGALAASVREGRNDLPLPNLKRCSNKILQSPPENYWKLRWEWTIKHLKFEDVFLLKMVIFQGSHLSFFWWVILAQLSVLTTHPWTGTYHPSMVYWLPWMVVFNGTFIGMNICDMLHAWNI